MGVLRNQNLRNLDSCRRNCAMDCRGVNGMELLEEVTNNAKEEQINLLTKILKKNSNVEYLQRHGLNGKTDIESYRTHIPIITYEDVEDDINRIANGDQSPILSVDTITELFTSSGTTKGKSKLIPSTEEQWALVYHVYHLRTCVDHHFIGTPPNSKDAFPVFVNTGSTTLGGLPKHFLGTSPNSKDASLVFVKTGSTTLGGLPKHFLSTSFIKRNIQHLKPFTTSLAEAFVSEDAQQSMYSHLLSALVMRDEVATISTSFASLMLTFITFLKDHWDSLCHDISTGTVNHTFVHSPNVRDALAKILRPDPGLAEAIQKECTTESWKGIIRRLWPNAKGIKVTVTGSMAQYVPQLEFYAGGLPLISSLYVCSEGLLGLNLNPLCQPNEVLYTLLPHVAYYEFIPEDGEDINNVVDLMGVEMGKAYEIVVTTIAGLYRYRVGDVLRVKGFYNKAPMFEFVCRKNAMISIHADKTDESEIQKAVANASSRHLEGVGINVVDYTAYADTSTSPGHYMLFMEISENDESSSCHGQGVLEKCCDTMEESLSSVYRHYRAEGLIGALEARTVRKGTFSRLMEAAVANGALAAQYKTPRAVTNNNMLELLQSQVTGNYYSTMIPHHED